MKEIKPNEIIENNKVFQGAVDRMKKLNEDINDKLIVFSEYIQNETQRNTKKIIDTIIENTNNIFADFEKRRKIIDESANHLIYLEEKNNK